MATKIIVLGVNEGVEEYEHRIIDYLTNELKAYDIELIDCSDDLELISEWDGNNGKVLLISDAVQRINPSFSRVVRELHQKGIIPLVLVSHIECPEANPKEAYFDAAIVAQYVDSSVDACFPRYGAVYFDYEQKKAFISFDDQNKSIDILAERIKEYCDED